MHSAMAHASRLLSVRLVLCSTRRTGSQIVVEVVERPNVVQADALLLVENLVHKFAHLHTCVNGM